MAASESLRAPLPGEDGFGGVDPLIKGPGRAARLPAIGSYSSPPFSFERERIGLVMEKPREDLCVEILSVVSRGRGPDLHYKKGLEQEPFP